MEAAGHVLIKVCTDEGLVGYAEAIPRLTIYGETQYSIVSLYLLSKKLAPRIIGLSVYETEKIWNRMEAIFWNPCAKAAIDMAIYDLIGKQQNVPVYKLLGGWNNQVRLTWIVSIKSVDAMAKKAQEKFNEGFLSFKLKAGLELRKDVEMVRLIKGKFRPNNYTY